MKHLKNSIILFIVLVGSRPTEAQIHVHSHNDYLQTRPFWEAFEAGVGSIEVDVFYKNRVLSVAHTEGEIKAERTLRSLYLEPLAKLMTAHDSITFDLILLIDCKTPAQTTLNEVSNEIQKYPELVDQSNPKRRVRFVISGNRPKPEKYKNTPAFIHFDHQSLDDLAKADVSKIEMVSFSFANFSRWDGHREPIRSDLGSLQNAIKKVHDLGKPIRFWATPDTKMAWRFLQELGVDYINTDRPMACQAYVNSIGK